MSERKGTYKAVRKRRESLETVWSTSKDINIKLITDNITMERKGIIAVGNWLVDSVKFIDVYPAKGNLATIRRVEEGLGGCAHNVLLDLASLKSGIPLYAGGCIGNDRFGEMALEACRKFGIDSTNMKIRDDVPTSYTDVMSEIGGSASRTFFHCYGANARLGYESIASCRSDAKIFHLGYLLLLPELDKEDPEYGVVAARALKHLLDAGYMTSVDVVSEEGDRFRKIVLPCLKYINYFIVNEVEAGACAGKDLRKADGTMDMENVRKAARELMSESSGTMKMCVIHYPEGGYALSSDGSEASVEPEMLPPDKIVSSVGAGDAFCAGTLYALHEGWNIDRMLSFASACARMNLRSSTATGGAPTLDEVMSNLR